MRRSGSISNSKRPNLPATIKSRSMQARDSVIRGLLGIVGILVGTVIVQFLTLGLQINCGG
jgi:hypothetical protein